MRAFAILGCLFLACADAGHTGARTPMSAPSRPPGGETCEPRAVERCHQLVGPQAACSAETSTSFQCCLELEDQDGTFWSCADADEWASVR